MELKDFVRESLKQIVQGVNEAQEPVRNHGGYINPTALPRGKTESHFGEFLPSGQQVFLVEFDVAVTVNENTGTHAEAKLQVATFLSLGAGGKSGDASCIEQLQVDIQLRLAGAGGSPQAQPAEHGTQSNKVFVVHGHNHGIKESVARFLEKLDLDPIILHENRMPVAP